MFRPILLGFAFSLVVKATLLHKTNPELGDIKVKPDNKHFAVIAGYIFNREEMESFFTTRQLVPHIPDESQEPVMQHDSRVRRRGNVDAWADCLGLNRIEEGYNYRHDLNEVECNHPFQSPFYTVTCNVVRRNVRANDFEPFTYWGITKVPGQCLRQHICTNIEKTTPTIGGVIKEMDISCVKQELDHYMRIMEAFHGHAHAAQAQTGCTDVTPVPGHQDGGSSSRPQTFVLTAEVFQHDGTQYKAPTMSIRDLSSKWKLDRAVRHDTSVVSTEITVGAWRGQLQSRKMQFCVELSAAAGQWVVLHYTWFRATSRHGIPSNALGQGQIMRSQLLNTTST